MLKLFLCKGQLVVKSFVIARCKNIKKANPQKFPKRYSFASQEHCLGSYLKFS